MSMKDFSIVNKIGTYFKYITYYYYLGDGAYSVVYKVKRQSDGQEYALKKVKMGSLSEKEKLNALNEVRILASLNHPNLIAFKEAFFEDASSSLCLVMEFANDGDLYQKILMHQKNGTLIDENLLWRILIQMVKGLKMLHQMKILHRDLKCANVFLNKDGTAKLGDLNVSKVAKKGLLYTQTGTPYYASPEVWKDQPYDSKSDIWSLGCVLYEMTTLKPPFRAQDMNGLYKRVLKGVYPSIPSSYSSDLSTMIKTLLQVQPSTRPTCDQILALDIVKKRLSLAKQQPNLLLMTNEQDLNLENLSLLNTIKVPRNLAQLTKNLPRSNYISTRESKFIQNQNQSVRLPSEPISMHSGTRLLPQINSMKDIRAPPSDHLSLNSIDKKNIYLQDQYSTSNQNQRIQKHKPLAQSVIDPINRENQGLGSRNLGIIQEKNEDRFKKQNLNQPESIPLSRESKQRKSNNKNQPPSSNSNHKLVKLGNNSASGMKDDFLSDLKLPQISEGSVLNLGLNQNINRGQRVIDKQRLQQVDMERKQTQQRKYLENVYGSSAGQNGYQNQEQYQYNYQNNGSNEVRINQQSLPPPLDRHSLISGYQSNGSYSKNLGKIKINYERVNPNKYGYSNSIQQENYSKVSPPIISTHNERGNGSQQSSKPTWWG
eukprot:403369168